MGIVFLFKKCISQKWKNIRKEEPEIQVYKQYFITFFDFLVLKRSFSFLSCLGFPNPRWPKIQYGHGRTQDGQTQEGGIKDDKIQILWGGKFLGAKPSKPAVELQQVLSQKRDDIDKCLQIKHPE